MANMYLRFDNFSTRVLDKILSKLSIPLERIVVYFPNHDYYRQS